MCGMPPDIESSPWTHEDLERWQAYFRAHEGRRCAMPQLWALVLVLLFMLAGAMCGVIAGVLLGGLP
jgi:hypothetical protein